MPNCFKWHAHTDGSCTCFFPWLVIFHIKLKLSCPPSTLPPLHSSCLSSCCRQGLLLRTSFLLDLSAHSSALRHFPNKVTQGHRMTDPSSCLSSCIRTAGEAHCVSLWLEVLPNSIDAGRWNGWLAASLFPLFRSFLHALPVLNVYTFILTPSL